MGSSDSRLYHQSGTFHPTAGSAGQDSLPPHHPHHPNPNPNIHTHPHHPNHPQQQQHHHHYPTPGGGGGGAYPPAASGGTLPASHWGPNGPLMPGKHPASMMDPLLLPSAAGAAGGASRRPRGVYPRRSLSEDTPDRREHMRIAADVGIMSRAAASGSLKADMNKTHGSRPGPPPPQPPQQQEPIRAPSALPRDFTHVPSVRRFSAGADCVLPWGSRGGDGAPALSTPPATNGGGDHQPPGRRRRSSSLIPQLAPLASYFKSGASASGASSRNSSTSSLQEIVLGGASQCGGAGEAAPSSTPPITGPAQYHRRRRTSMQDALDYTKINTSLYLPGKKSDSVRSSDSSDSLQDSSSECGRVNFSLSYDPDQSLLKVRLHQARDLTPAPGAGAVNPYCSLRLLPQTRTRLHSKTIRNTLCPEFEEDFIFEVSRSHVADRTLEIRVHDAAQFSRDDCIGVVKLSLYHVDLADSLALWKTLQSYEKQKEERVSQGEVMFSLSYLPSAERLTVVVIKARNLRYAEQDNKLPQASKGLNTFVKVTLVAAGKRLKRKKTSTKRGTCSPTWNEALVFGLGKEFLKTIQLEFLVCNEALLGNNEHLGKILIGPGSSGEELAHWNDVMNSKKALAWWHDMVPVEL